MSEYTATDDDVKVAVEIFRSTGRASISSLQRRMRLSYWKACAIMEELEKRKLVGPQKGAEPRELHLERYRVEGRGIKDA